MPLSALAKRRKSASNTDPVSDPTSALVLLTIGPRSDPGSDTERDAGPDAGSDTMRALRVLESAVEGLREQLTVANQRADRAEQRALVLQAALDARSTPARRSWWRWR